LEVFVGMPTGYEAIREMSYAEKFCLDMPLKKVVDTTNLSDCFASDR